MASEILGKPDSAQRDQYRYMDLNARAEALYLYLCFKKSMEDVTHDISRLDNAQQVSLVTRCNGFYIEGKRSVESNRYGKAKPGSNNKVLASPYPGIVVKGPLDLRKSDFVEFVANHPEGELDYRVIDRFMVAKHFERHPELLPADKKLQNENTNDTYDTDFTPVQGGQSGGMAGAGGGAVAVAALGIVGIVVIIFLVKLIGGFVTHNFGYYLDKFEYASYTYVGNKNFGSPKGQGMRFKGLNGEAFDIGYMKKKNVSGESILYDGKGTLVAGTAKKSKANGWCAEENRDSGHVHFAKFKKGNKSGYGVCFYNGTSKLVQFTKDGEKEIAEYTSDGWKKSNGKNYNASKKLKNVEIISGTEFVVDEATYKLFPNAFSYEKGKCRMNGNHSGVGFENEIDMNIIFAVQYVVGQSLEILEVNMDTMETLGQFTAHAQ